MVCSLLVNILFLVDKFMNRDVVMIDVNADSRRIRELLGEYKHNVFPLVDSLQSRILIGSITRSEMSKSLEMSMTRPLESASVNPGMGINISNKLKDFLLFIPKKHQQWYPIK